MSEPSRPFVPGAALLLLLVYYAASAVVLLIGDCLSDEQVGPMFFAAAAVVAPLAATYVGLVRHAPEERTAQALRIELPHSRTLVHIFLGLVCGIALAPLGSELTAKIVALLANGAAPDDGLAEWIAMAQQTPTQTLIILCFVTRELLFRGVMLPRLLGTVGIFRAVALVGLFDVCTQPVGPSLLTTVPFCLLALASRSTLPSIAASLVLMLAPTDLLVPQPTLALFIVSAAIAAGAVALSWRLRVVDSTTSSTPPSAQPSA